MLKPRGYVSLSESLRAYRSIKGKSNLALCKAPLRRNSQKYRVLRVGLHKEQSLEPDLNCVRDFSSQAGSLCSIVDAT